MHFAPLKKEQATLVKKWLHQDYIAKFWYGVGLENTLKSIDRYIEGKENLYTLWIAYDGKIPFGYLMKSKVNLEKDLLYAKYLHPSAKAMTLDLLIGNRDYLGKGLAHQMILHFLKECCKGITDVFIDPGIDNVRAIHVYEKAGFHKLEEFIPDWEPDTKCLLMHRKIEK